MDSMRSLLSTSDFLQVREHKLSNDLTVWLNEDHSQPKIFGAVVVKPELKIPLTQVSRIISSI